MAKFPPLKNCPCCNSKVSNQDDSEYYFDCPNCGELFQTFDGKVLWTNDEGQPTNLEVKPKAFLFRETGLNYSFF